MRVETKSSAHDKSRPVARTVCEIGKTDIDDEGVLPQRRKDQSRVQILPGPIKRRRDARHDVYAHAAKNTDGLMMPQHVVLGAKPTITEANRGRENPEGRVF